MSVLILPLADPQADVPHVGGKGASLARLAAAGFDVPDGFHITTGAYEEFVRSRALRERILSIVQECAGDVDGAEVRVKALFAATPMPTALAQAVTAAYARLGDGPVAVRSSATAEDLDDASFAGQQDSFLDVRGATAVVAAVRACWASLWNARAIAYRARQGIEPGAVNMGVVVQRMVDADAAGVLFTADPVTGRTDRVVINAVRGQGEPLVAGVRDPQGLVLAREPLAVLDRHGEPVLEDGSATDVATVGLAVERLFERPMDVEWAVVAGRVVVLQARPITVAAPEEWNDSLTGDYLWTCANLGEAIPSVMTPLTWSLVQIFMSETMSVYALGQHRVCGRIGGRFYLNLSMVMAAGSALGLTSFVRRSLEEPFGRIPAEVEIPPLPMSTRAVLRELVPTVARFLRRVGRVQHRFAARIAAFPARCDTVRATIAAASNPAELASCWELRCDPLLRDASLLLAAGARMDGTGLVRLRPWLRKLVGEEDAIVLSSGLHRSGSPLASLGPLVALDRLARGEIDGVRFAREWGHRCPDEFEISVARPSEDPGWIDRQLAGLEEARRAGTDVGGLLARQRAARAAALTRLRERRPRRAAALERRLARVAKGLRAREAGRSEVIRAFAVLRAFALRAGELTGVGDEVFLLSAQELLIVLGGDRAPLTAVPSRREAYRRYRALPPYPILIRGAFDPMRWAADPNRRTDVFDGSAGSRLAPVPAAVTGFPGAAGVVEGLARVLRSLDEGDQLRAGEILVTTVTNVGWTPLFPRVAAIVTDIGAPLSHAAIVARELGIPAVVGTGNATTRLRTGDRLRVDGRRGTVEVLEAGAACA